MVKLLESGDYFCPDGIKMNVTDEGQKIVVFVTQDRFVSIFKEMSGAAMAAVKVLGIPREKLAHDD